jgi:hypothetical protein
VVSDFELSPYIVLKDHKRDSKRFPNEIPRFPAFACELGSAHMYSNSLMRHKFRGSRFAADNIQRRIVYILIHIVRTGDRLNLPPAFINEARILFWKRKHDYNVMSWTGASCLWYVMQIHHYSISYEEFADMWTYLIFSMTATQLRSTYHKLFQKVNRDTRTCIILQIHKYLDMHPQELVILDPCMKMLAYFFPKLSGHSPTIIASSILYFQLKRHKFSICQHTMSEFFGHTEVSLRNLVHYFQKHIPAKTI